MPPIWVFRRSANTPLPGGGVYATSCTEIIHSEVDCTVEEYENLACAVLSLSDSAQFKPSFHESESLAACIALAEIIYHHAKICAQIWA